MKLLLLALALTACAPAVVQSQPPVVVVTPAPAPLPVPAPVVVVVPPASLPTGPLLVLDSTAVTVTLQDQVLTIRLTDDAVGAWVRLVLPDGTVSPVTQSPGCACLGLGGASAHSFAVSFLPGLSVETSASPLGPWTPAARTR